MTRTLVALTISSLCISAACSRTSPTAPDRVSANLKPTVSGEDTVAATVTTQATPAQTTTFPIQWTLTRTSCPELWADSVTGTGTTRMMIRVASGQINLAATSSGTAVDSNGGQFRFTSVNTRLLIAGPPFQSDLTQTFSLFGPGGKEYRLQVGSVVLFKVDANGNVFLDEIRSRGDVSCIPS